MEEERRTSTTRFSRRGPQGDVETVKETVVTKTEEVDEPTMVMKQHHHHEGSGMGWGWSLASIVMWFIVLTVFIWLILFSLRPSWVLVSGSQEVNLAMVLGVSLLIDLKVLKVFTTQTEAHEWVRLGGFEDTSDESCGKYYKILEL